MEENIDIPLTEPDIQNVSSVTELEIIQEHGAESYISEKNELVEKLKEYELRVSNLSNELSSKTDVITDLEKQKSLFEKEVTHVSLQINFSDSHDWIWPFSS